MKLFNDKKNSSFKPNDTSVALHRDLEFAAKEQYKLLRTNLKFAITDNVKCPIIGVTSSVRGEAKSTTAINLSYVLAEKGHKVLLIDGDLRLPSIAKKMEINSTPGLTDLLIGSSADISSWRTDINKNWYVLPSGELPPNPSELLGSKRMENVLNVLKEHFDYIILDLPPVNIVSDAMSVAHLITGMIIVFREGYTSKKEFDACMRQVKMADVNVLGYVMTDSGESSASYSKYGKNKYNRYESYGYGDADNS